VQDRVTELEARLAQTCAELATSRAVEVRLQQRLAGSKTAAEVEALYARLDAAESAAARADDSTAALTLRAEEAERRAAEALAQRQRHLADLTSLRWGSEGSLSMSTGDQGSWGSHCRVTMSSGIQDVELLCMHCCSGAGNTRVAATGTAGPWSTVYNPSEPK
jgi:hypothetical protein